MIQELIDLCQGRLIYIQTHNFPDPDALASAFGLQKLLNKFEIESVLCYEGSIDSLCASNMLKQFGIEIYSYADILPVMTEDDYIICVDSQKHSGNITDFCGDEVACIDHHPTFVPIEYRYKDVRITGACATLITEYYMSIGLVPDTNTATALLYGIKMDTLNFTRGVTELDIEAFTFLFPLADTEVISRLEHSTMEIQDLKAYGAAIEHIQIYDSFGFTVIPFMCPDAQVAMLADFILTLDQVEVVLVISVREDGVKLSVRSEVTDVHAGQLVYNAIKKYGTGGGHATMAGGFIPNECIALFGEDMEEMIKLLFLQQLEKMM